LRPPALCRVIEPLFEARFVAETYANRRGKGTHRALARCQELSRRFPFVLACDVRQFFPSIDHRILRRLLAQVLADGQVLSLIDRILAGGEGVLSEEYRMVYFPGDDLFAIHRPRGLPIGNLTSQFWANVYLDPVDHLITGELGCAGYVRYVDDLLLFGETKRRLWEWKREIEAALADLRLTIHPGTHPRPVGEGIGFLGFRVAPHRRRLKRRKGIHFRRRLRSLLQQFEQGDLSGERLLASVRGWLNHVRSGDTAGLRREILRALPGEIAHELR
jgi:hypothetical protein